MYTRPSPILHAPRPPSCRIHSRVPGPRAGIDGDLSGRLRTRGDDNLIDTVSFEVGLTRVLPGGGAIRGGRPGPIQCRADFRAYPWEELPREEW